MENRRLELVVCPVFYPGAESICKGLPVLALEGIKSVELALNSPPYFDCHNPDQVDKLVAMLTQIPLEVRAIHAPFGAHVDFSSFDDNIHEHGVDAQIEAIEIARLLGASYVIVHASEAGVVTDRKKRLDRARGVLRELAVVAEEAEVKLAVENLPSGFLCGEIDEVKWLVDSIDSPSLGVCFDTGHANLSGHFNRWAQELIPMTITMHIHDNDGQSDQHLFPGLGNIDWRLFMRLYRESKCSACFALECGPPKGINWTDGLGLVRSCFDL